MIKLLAGALIERPMTRLVDETQADFFRRTAERIDALEVRGFELIEALPGLDMLQRPHDIARIILRFKVDSGE